jgi:tRNA pseudouridine13 synthase
MFLFKQKSQDFIVEEKLPFELTGKWDAFFVYIEKRNKNTADILQHLCSKFKISRKTIGIAWLKDKKALARQRISIYKRALTELWWENVRVDALKEVSTVRKTSRHTTPLNMSTWISNRFHIRLRAEKTLSQSEREDAVKILENILKNWYSNVFGAQRFGINGRNTLQWREIIDGTSQYLKVRHSDRKEITFKLQAYASSIFNSYFLARKRDSDNWSSRFKNKKKPKIIDGDILELAPLVEWMQYWSYIAENQTVQLFENSHSELAYKHPKWKWKMISYDATTMHLTGPVPWFDLLLPTPTSDAGRYEHQFLKDQGLKEKNIATFEHWKVYWLRRRLWVEATDAWVRFQWDDLLLDFTLPAGSYASTLVDEMMKKLMIKDVSYKKVWWRGIDKSKSKFKKSHEEVRRPKKKF